MTTFLWRYKRRHEYNELERIVKVSINAKDKMLIVELLPYKLHWNMHGKACAFILLMLDLLMFQGDSAVDKCI